MARFKGSINLGPAISGLASAAATEAEAGRLKVHGATALGQGVGGGLAAIGAGRRRKQELADARAERDAVRAEARTEDDRRLKIRTASDLFGVKSAQHASLSQQEDSMIEAMVTDPNANPDDPAFTQQAQDIAQRRARRVGELGTLEQFIRGDAGLGVAPEAPAAAPT